MNSGIEDCTGAGLEILNRAVERAKRKTCDYLTRRQSPSGGFCFYRSEHADHPNVADTGCAVRTFALLGIEIPNAHRVTSFLEDQNAIPQPEFLFNLASALRKLKGNGLSQAVAGIIRQTDFEQVPGPQFQQTGWLERARFLACLKRMIGEGQEVTEIAAYVRGLAVEGGFGTTPNLWDTWLALKIVSLGGQLTGLEDTVRFIDELQRKPCGFTLRPDTQVASLNVVFAGVQCCQFLGMSMRYPAHGLRFALACQADSGGFACSPGALPDFQLTERALWTIRQLCAVLRMP